METLLSLVRLDLMMEDKWLWTKGESSFLVASVYRFIIYEVSDGLPLVNFPFWSFWKCVFLSKVLAFFWRLILERLPTRVALVRMGVMVEDNGCVFCGTDRKDLQHLFLGATSRFRFGVRSTIGGVFLWCNIRRFHFSSWNMVFFRGKRVRRVCYLIWHAIC